MKHTKGKWEKNGYPRLTVQSAEGEICLINPNIKEDDANAKLISKAPEMLEALKELVKQLDDNYDKIQFMKSDKIRAAKSLIKAIES